MKKSERGVALLAILGCVWLAGVAFQIGVWVFTGKTRECKWASRMSPPAVAKAICTCGDPLPHDHLRGFYIRHPTKP